MLILGCLCTNTIVHFMMYQTKKAKTHSLSIQKVILKYGLILYQILKKQNFDNLITLFKTRFKDKQQLLNLTILQIHQGRNEYVLHYLSQLYQLATNRNILDDILLAVAMNWLKSELKTIVMTKEPKHVEELRHCPSLSETSYSF